MKKLRIFTVLAFVLVMTFALTACGGTTYKHSETVLGMKVEGSVTLSGSKFTMVYEMSGMGEEMDFKFTLKGKYTQDGEKITFVVSSLTINKGSDEMKETLNNDYEKDAEIEATLVDDVLTMMGAEYTKQ